MIMDDTFEGEDLLNSQSYLRQLQDTLQEIDLIDGGGSSSRGAKGSSHHSEYDYDSDEYDSEDDDVHMFGDEDDPDSGENELYAMMDSLVAELQAEMQGQIVDEYVGFGGGGDDGELEVDLVVEEEEEDVDGESEGVVEEEEVDLFRHHSNEEEVECHDISIEDQQGYDDDNDNNNNDDDESSPALISSSLVQSYGGEDINDVAIVSDNDDDDDDDGCDDDNDDDVPPVMLRLSSDGDALSSCGGEDTTNNSNNISNEISVPLHFEQLQAPKKDADPDFVSVADYCPQQIKTTEFRSSSEEVEPVLSSEVVVKAKSCEEIDDNVGVHASHDEEIRESHDIPSLQHQQPVQTTTTTTAVKKVPSIATPTKSALFQEPKTTIIPAPGKSMMPPQGSPARAKTSSNGRKHATSGAKKTACSSSIRPIPVSSSDIVFPPKTRRDNEITTTTTTTSVVTTVASDLSKRLIQHIKAHTLQRNTKSSIKNNKRSSMTTTAIIHDGEEEDKSYQRIPDLETSLPNAKFEKLKDVSSHDPDYVPIRDYTSSPPQKQMEGDRMGRNKHFEKLGNVSPGDPDFVPVRDHSNSKSSIQTRDQEDDITALKKKRRGKRDKDCTKVDTIVNDEGKECDALGGGGVAGTGTKQRPTKQYTGPRKKHSSKQRTNKHLKTKKRLEKLLVESMLEETDETPKSRDEMIRALANSTVWTTFVGQTFFRKTTQ